MLTATRRTLTSAMDPNLDPAEDPMDGTAAAVPAPVPAPTPAPTPAASPTTTAPTPSAAPMESGTDSAPATSVGVAERVDPAAPGGGVTGITQLPDGAGGAVPVPPTPLAPPSVVPPAPWEGSIQRPMPIAEGAVDPMAPLAPSGTAANPWETGTADPVPDPLVAAPAPVGPQAPAAPVVPSGPVDVNPWEVADPGPAGSAQGSVLAPPPVPDIDPNAPATVPAADTAGGGATGVDLPSFTADENLLDKTILPAQSARELEHQQAVDAGLAKQDAAADILPSADPRLLKFQSMSDEALNKLLNGPNRLDIAKQMWDTFSQETEGDYTRSLTDATNAGAAHGRIGSGILTNSYGDLAERRGRDLNAAKGHFLNDALEGTIGDQRAAYDAVSGAERNAFGEGESNNAQLRTERQNRLNLIAQHYGLMNDEQAAGQQARGEARTERGYQDSQAQRSIANYVLQHQMESGDDQQAFENAMKLFQAGNQYSPENAYESAAGQASAEAAGQSASVQQLMALIAQLQAKGAAPAGS